LTQAFSGIPAYSRDGTNTTYCLWRRGPIMEGFKKHHYCGWFLDNPHIITNHKAEPDFSRTVFFKSQHKRPEELRKSTIKTLMFLSYIVEIFTVKTLENLE
jgi:hypothetical protein